MWSDELSLWQANGVKPGRRKQSLEVLKYFSIHIGLSA